MDKTKKPLGVIILGGFNCFVRGFLSLAAAGYIYFGSNLSSNKILEEIKNHLPTNTNFSAEQLKAALGIEMAVSLIFMVSGAGLLHKKEWGRKLTLYFSFFIVLLAFISVIASPSMIAQALIQIIYPGILIIYFTNKRVENYFLSRPPAEPRER